MIIVEIFFHTFISIAVRANPVFITATISEIFAIDNGVLIIYSDVVFAMNILFASSRIITTSGSKYICGT
jgi:hypothetical protein